MFNEREIIPRILRGDLSAFNLLVKQYEKLVFHVVYKTVIEREDAEDICQEVFIKIYKNIGAFAFQSKLSTWIAKIAYSTSINYFKKYKKQVVQSFSEDLENYHITDIDPEGLLMKKDISDYVNYLINQMPYQYKLVISLYHLDEFSYLEIEEITGMPEGTIKSYLFRGRRLLKEKLEIYLKNEL